jgi:hypothetical protein
LKRVVSPGLIENFCQLAMERLLSCSTASLWPAPTTAALPATTLPPRGFAKAVLADTANATGSKVVQPGKLRLGILFSTRRALFTADTYATHLLCGNARRAEFCGIQWNFRVASGVLLP